MIMTTEYKNINAPPYSPDILDIYIYIQTKTNLKISTSGTYI